MTEFPALKNEFIFAEAKTMKRNPVQKTMKRNPAQKMRAIFVQTLHDNVKKNFVTHERSDIERMYSTFKI